MGQPLWTSKMKSPLTWPGPENLIVLAIQALHQLSPGPCTLHHEAVVAHSGVAVGQTLWYQLQEPAILPTSHRRSLSLTLSCPWDIQN